MLLDRGANLNLRHVQIEALLTEVMQVREMEARWHREESQEVLQK